MNCKANNLRNNTATEFWVTPPTLKPTQSTAWVNQACCEYVFVCVRSSVSRSISIIYFLSDFIAKDLTSSAPFSCFNRMPFQQMCVHVFASVINNPAVAFWYKGNGLWAPLNDKLQPIPPPNPPRLLCVWVSTKISRSWQMCEEYSYYNLGERHLQYVYWFDGWMDTATDINRAEEGKVKGKDARRQKQGCEMEFKLVLIPVGKCFLSLILSSSETGTWNQDVPSYCITFIWHWFCSQRLAISAFKLTNN